MTGLEDQKLAVLTLIHPGSVEKKQKVLDNLLSRASDALRRPESQCLTWTCFTPATRQGAKLGMVVPPTDKDTMVGVLQTYSTETPSETEIGKSVNWYPSAGFVARKGEQQTAPAQIVMLAKFVCKDGQGTREKLVDVLGKFCDWVEANEPTTLTYCVMTRPDAPNEVLMFERYKDLAALGVHGKSKEFRDMFKATGPFVQGRKTVLSEWEEVQGSFVSNHAGGAGSRAKL